MKLTQLSYSILVLVFLFVEPINAQNNENIRTISDEVNATQVDEIAKVIEYNKTKTKLTLRDKKQPEDQKTQNSAGEDENSDDSNSGSFGLIYNFLYYAIVIVVLFGLCIMVYFFISNITTDSSLKIKEEDFNEEEEIEDIQDLNLAELLDNALAALDYRQAIRVNFLQLLQSLSTHKFIEWSKEKTNLDYLKEIRPQAFFQNFRTIVGLFERTYYGDIEVDKETYTKAAPVFEALRNSINTIDR